MKDAYFGNEYSDAVIKSELDRYNIQYRELEREALLDRTAEEIKNGNVVGWFQGRMEWGPRALGNRSIWRHSGLSQHEGNSERPNQAPRMVSSFRSVRFGQRQSELFEQDYPSPFMMHVYKIRPEWRERLSAVNHVDDTGRLQTVSHDENPLYYDLISVFGSRPEFPLFLIQAYNENEPIVCQPSEAIECFLRTKMDVLVIGSFFCNKND